jgi:hypothetical protein
MVAGALASGERQAKIAANTLRAGERQQTTGSIERTSQKSSDLDALGGQ